VQALQAHPGWKQIVRSSGARIAVLQAAEPLSYALEGHGWEVVARDRGYVMLQPSGS
jgi:hypothetical protein